MAEMFREGSGEAIEQQELMRIKNVRAMNTIRSTKSKAEAQLAREYQRYIEAKEKGDVKMANEALKMWNFINKMNELANRFITTLERVESIQDLFDMLQSTSALFGEIMALDNNAVMRDMKKNLRTFKKKLKQYEKQMESVFDLIDNLFDERPNPIVRFFNWLFGKKEKSPEEVLEANEKKFGSAIAAYGEAQQQAQAQGTEGTTTTPKGPTTKPTTPTTNNGDDGFL